MIEFQGELNVYRVRIRVRFAYQVFQWFIEMEGVYEFHDLFEGTSKEVVAHDPRRQGGPDKDSHITKGRGHIRRRSHKRIQCSGLKDHLFLKGCIPRRCTVPHIVPYHLFEWTQLDINANVPFITG
jgi:hypothetical protein